MKTFCPLLLVALFTAASLNSQAPDWYWANWVASLGPDSGTSIARDGDDNLYVTGHYSMGATFGSIELQSGTYQELFVAKASPMGDWIWASTAQGSLYKSGVKAVSDQSGNVYVAGNFWSQVGTAVFGSTTLTGPGGFVAKLDSSGGWVWAVGCPATINDLALDAGGSPYITGSFSGTMILGSNTLVSNGQTDLYVAIMNNEGSWVAASQGGGPNSDGGTAIDVDYSGQVYVAGYFWDYAYFGGGLVDGENDTTMLVASREPDGDWGWVQAVNTVQTGPEWNADRIADLIFNNGYIYVTGHFSGNASFGSTMLVSGGSVEDAFVARLSPGGDWLWARQAGGADNDFGNAMASDDQGNCYLTGTFRGAADFGSSHLTSAMSNDDAFVAKLSPMGDWYWAQHAYGGNAWDQSYGIAVDALDNCYITGKFDGTVAFGNTSFTDAGETDIFIARLGSAVGVTDESNPPLADNWDLSVWPNPSSGEVKLTVQSGKATGQGIASLAVYNCRGQRQRGWSQLSLDDKKTLVWDGADEAGHTCGSGIYLVCLKIGDQTVASRRVSLIR